MYCRGFVISDRTAGRHYVVVCGYETRGFFFWSPDTSPLLLKCQGHKKHQVILNNHQFVKRENNPEISRKIFSLFQRQMLINIKNSNGNFLPGLTSSSLVCKGGFATLGSAVFVSLKASSLSNWIDGDEKYC